MRFFPAIIAVLAAVIVTGAAPAMAQQRPSTGSGRSAANAFPDAPGKEVLVAKCFQCHSPNMWSDLHQDRRAWEATLYRMVGRGALWSEDEIKKMADYLGATHAREPSVFGREPVQSPAAQ
ncbi:MAG TPA: hypothetical protein VI319_16880 [Burkholderiales bacterium]